MLLVALVVVVGFSVGFSGDGGGVGCGIFGCVTSTRGKYFRITNNCGGAICV